MSNQAAKSPRSGAQRSLAVLRRRISGAAADLGKPGAEASVAVRKSAPIWRFPRPKQEPIK